MRFLPTKVHGMIDYLWGLALLSTPWLFGFADNSAATWTAAAFGLGAILYSAITAYEVGLLKLLPMPLHLILDGVAGLALAASPFLFGFADRVYWPHVLFGLFSVAASLNTYLEPVLPTGRREPA
ncbi:hypothetical protein HPT29_012140 [Microvirga terrae]|uniref:SPW repeat-containing integral membrane domain-containing protein n=1 Tax=Microvirga terrae TaxID=2740529 RepID=A0ABY5S0K2_9HYPH|nr:hypothetical protein [Microvirga terrae]UVF21804.1 hypothetical protein HPT29_012140 [Microvirga terrae]